MDYQLKGKLAFVTAGANGIGAAIASLLTQQGASVIVADQDEATLRECGRARRETCVADLPTSQGIEKAIAYVPEPMPLDYGLFKMGVLHLTKSLAKAYVPHVRVNAVSAGPVWTGLFSRSGGIADQIAAQFGLDRDAAVKKFLEDRYIPLGFGEPADVANAKVFLASPLAKFITGANLDLGGTLRGML